MDRYYSYGFLVTSDGLFCGKISNYKSNEVLFISKKGISYWSRVENYYTEFNKALNAYLETFRNVDGLKGEEKLKIRLN